MANLEITALDAWALREAALKKFPFGGTRPMARVFHEDGLVAEW